MTATPPPGWQQPGYGYPAMPPAPTPPSEMPGSVRTAINLMWAAVALTVVGFLVGLLMMGTTIEEATAEIPEMNEVSTNTLIGAGVAMGVFLTLVTVGLYVLVIVYVRRGANWARVLGTVLGGLFLASSALTLPFSLVTGEDWASILITLASAVLAAVTLYFLWKKESGPWFLPRQPRYT